MGLNFQTQTIINLNEDRDSSIAGKKAVLFEAVKTKVDGVEVDALKIKRDFLFVKENIKAIRKAEGYDAVACKATIDFSKIADIQPTEAEPKKYCRLDIYLGVEGAEPFIYATPWVQKGMPFWVEFTVNNDNKGKIAEVVAEMIKKNHLFLVDKDLLTVAAEGNVLTLTGNTEYQRFRKIEVRTFSATDDYAELVSEMSKKPAENAEGEVTEAYEASAVKEEERGKNSFGTYSQIIKDLRLPTAANYQWTHLRQDETPTVGAIYNQYIIEYCAPATNDGTQFVGHRGLSHTTHVFWVRQDDKLISEWETALGTVDPDGDTLVAENIAPTTSKKLADLTKKVSELEKA